MAKAGYPRDRCYHIPDKSGKGYIRIRAGRKPDATTTVALQNLFDAAYKHMAAALQLGGSGPEKPGR